MSCTLGPSVHKLTIFRHYNASAVTRPRYFLYTAEYTARYTAEYTAGSARDLDSGEGEIRVGGARQLLASMVCYVLQKVYLCFVTTRRFAARHIRYAERHVWPWTCA
jgi:hypothetical protein